MHSVEIKKRLPERMKAYRAARIALLITEGRYTASDAAKTATHLTAEHFRPVVDALPDCNQETAQRAFRIQMEQFNA